MSLKAFARLKIAVTQGRLAEGGQQRVAPMIQNQIGRQGLSGQRRGQRRPVAAMGLRRAWTAPARLHPQFRGRDQMATTVKIITGRRHTHSSPAGGAPDCDNTDSPWRTTRQWSGNHFAWAIIPLFSKGKFRPAHPRDPQQQDIVLIKKNASPNVYPSRSTPGDSQARAANPPKQCMKWRGTFFYTSPREYLGRGRNHDILNGANNVSGGKLKLS